MAPFEAKPFAAGDRVRVYNPGTNNPGLTYGTTYEVRACYLTNADWYVTLDGHATSYLAGRFELDSQFADEPDDELINGWPVSDAQRIIDAMQATEARAAQRIIDDMQATARANAALHASPAGLDVVGVKYDTGKPPIGLIPVEAQFAEAAVLAYGAKKYAAHNWRLGMDWTRLSDAALRHILAWVGGEDLDPETGLSHLAHARCDLGFLLGYAETGAGTDDRWKAAA